MNKDHNYYKQLWKSKLQNLDKATRTDLKKLINRYYLLDSMVYVYCMERKNISGEKFLDPIVVNCDTPTLMACNNLIELQQAYKKDIDDFLSMGIRTTIIPMAFPDYWELNASIVPIENTNRKYGTSFIAHKDTYKLDDGAPVLLHSLHSFDFKNVCVKNLNSDFNIVERQKYVPIIVESNLID